MRVYFVGLDVHKQVIAFCVKTAEGAIVKEGSIPATRTALSDPEQAGHQTFICRRSMACRVVIWARLNSSSGRSSWPIHSLSFTRLSK